MTSRGHFVLHSSIGKQNWQPELASETGEQNWQAKDLNCYHLAGLFVTYEGIVRQL